MKFLKNLFKFKVKEASPIPPVAPPPPEPPKKELPTEIEISWKEAAPLMNLQSACDRIDENMREMFYKHKWEERKIFESLVRTEEALKGKINEVYERADIPLSSRREYEILLPQVRGKPGVLKKKKKSTAAPTERKKE
tara:strand:- start:360 stop:773 length:414 start_codon:yes stop_codon:yes gene_type:complete